MRNAIEACEAKGARLFRLDNVFTRGKVAGPMAEVTPARPSRAKGEVRARLTGTWQGEIAAGRPSSGLNPRTV